MGLSDIKVEQEIESGEIMIDFRLHGLGGQGIVTFSHLLSQVALVNGLYSQSLPFFGVERRGASVTASVRMDSQPILFHSQCQKPDYIVVMNKSQLQKALSMGIGELTKIIVSDKPVEDNKNIIAINASQIAIDNGLVHDNIPFVNIPMFGAVCKIVQFSRASVEKVLRENRKGKTAEFDVKAALQAYEAIYYAR